MYRQYQPTEAEMLTQSIDNFMMQPREPQTHTIETVPSLHTQKDLQAKASYATKLRNQSAKYEEVANPARAQQDMLMSAIMNANAPQQPRNNVLEQAIYNQQQQDQQRQMDNQASQQYFQQQQQMMPMTGYEGGSENGQGQAMEKTIVTGNPDQPGNGSAQSRIREVANDSTKKISF